MNAAELIEYIRTAEKKTPVKVYIWERFPTSFPNAKVFPAGYGAKIVFGDWRDIGPAVQAQQDAIADIVIESSCRNSAVPLLDTKGLNARVEPGAIIREQVEIGEGAVIMMGAIINIGSVIGELLHIEDGVTRAGDWLQKRFGKSGSITEGFVTGSLVFAAGAMAVMGALESGLKNDHTILMTKSVIDMAGSVAFAGSLGIGVAFSALSILVLEGTVALLASLLTGVLTEAVITEISVTGSLLIIGIGLNVLGLTKLRIMNMAPALLLPILLCRFM